MSIRLSVLSVSACLFHVSVPYLLGHYPRTEPASDCLVCQVLLVPSLFSSSPFGASSAIHEHQIFFIVCALFHRLFVHFLRLTQFTNIRYCLCPVPPSICPFPAPYAVHEHKIFFIVCACSTVFLSISYGFIRCPRTSDLNSEVTVLGGHRTDCMVA